MVPIIVEALYKVAKRHQLEATTPAGTKYAVTGDVLRELAAVAIDVCAKRAEYGDFETGMGCDAGYSPTSMTARVRKEAADDIRRLAEWIDETD
jgi:hypothetical protein